MFRFAEEYNLYILNEILKKSKNNSNFMIEIIWLVLILL